LEAITAALEHQDCFVIMATGMNKLNHTNIKPFLVRWWEIFMLSITSRD